MEVASRASVDYIAKSISVTEADGKRVLKLPLDAPLVTLC